MAFLICKHFVVIISFLQSQEGIAVGRSLGMLKNEQIDGNKEMIAFGLMNIVGANLVLYVPFCRILRWVEEEENLKKKDADLQYVLFSYLVGVTSIDNTGIGMLTDVHKNLGRKGIRIALTNLRREVAEKLTLSRYIESIGGDDWVFLSVKAAVAACRFALQEIKHNSPPCLQKQNPTYAALVSDGQARSTEGQRANRCGKQTRSTEGRRANRLKREGEEKIDHSRK
ncbi:STAS domain [Musa troglodytarum]|uniref:STAS domain n=1 Tax=Musa troglodytarum TaxID=320322 RepID=A0A9E7GXE2_9LILI|nr:STAS domain [Musa troglodytarum]URE21496.1 STAS domain [Musa troglodytarum]